MRSRPGSPASACATARSPSATSPSVAGHGAPGRPLRAPLLISAMTGGVREATVVNERLTRAAAEHGVAMTLGSGRALLEDPSLLHTYVGTAPESRPPLLLANLGAAQLGGADGPARAERLVEQLSPDGLVIHLNPIQEAVQPEGEPRFAGVAERIAAVVERLAPMPVVVKEVGFGVDAADVALLRDAGVAAVDRRAPLPKNDRLGTLAAGARDPGRGEPRPPCPTAGSSSWRTTRGGQSSRPAPHQRGAAATAGTLGEVARGACSRRRAGGWRRPSASSPPCSRPVSGFASSVMGPAHRIRRCPADRRQTWRVASGPLRGFDRRQVRRPTSSRAATPDDAAQAPQSTTTRPRPRVRRRQRAGDDMALAGPRGRRVVRPAPRPARCCSAVCGAARPASRDRRASSTRCSSASGFDQKGIRRPAPIGIASESQLAPAASRADALACSIRPAPSRCGVGSAGTNSVPGRELAGGCGDSRSRRRPRGARSPSVPDGRRSGRHLGRLRLARRPVDDAAQLGTAGRTDQARLRLIVLERIAVLHGRCGRLDRRPRSARAIRRGRWSVGIWRKPSGEVPDHVDAPRYGRRPGCTGRG
jgi:hypothetical protein